MLSAASPRAPNSFTLKSPLLTPSSARSRSNSNRPSGREVLSPMDSYVKKTPRGGKYYSTLVASENEEEEADISLFDFRTV